MPSCSKLRKADCETSDDCKWEVGKGCRAADKKSASASSSDTNEFIVTDADIKKVLAQVHPDSGMTADAKLYIKTIITKLVKGTFKKASVSTFGQDEVAKLYMLGSNLTEVGQYAEKEGVQHVMNPKRSLINIKGMLKRIPIRNKNSQVVTFTEKGGYYLVGIVEYAIAEIVEVGGNVARKYKKNRLTEAFIKEAINDDADLRDVFDRKNIGRLVQV
jgi:hypothetical protein